jgi:GntR family transcriptional repressor for pyruvate dehydrogenase complex
MMLKAVKKTRVYEDIVSQVKELIAEGKLRPGDQLPSERELSEMFQVSRASVREAIRALESIRLIEIRQGEGTYIASPPLPSQLNEPPLRRSPNSTQS